MSAPSPDYTPPPWPVALARMALRLALLLGLAYGVHLALDWMMYATDALPEAHQATAVIAIAAVALALYALLIAVPFVPGIEIGLTLLMIRGAGIAPAVYLATLAGLLLAYFAGRYLPLSWLHRLFLDLRLTGACRLIDRLDPLAPAERLQLLQERLPDRLAAGFLRWRYLWLALLVNLPGSGLIGGGGGILMLAGLTGVFAPGAVLLTLALAVAPVPLLVWLAGPEVLG